MSENAAETEFFAGSAFIVTYWPVHILIGREVNGGDAVF
jgi:hypothetical protein